MLDVSTKSKALGLLTKLLEAYSPTFHEEQAVRTLEEELLNLGYEHVEIDGVGNLIAETGKGSITVLLAGHIDTVEGQIPVKIEGDRVYGRGAVDAKGPLAAMAVAGLLATSLISDLKVVLAALVGEEGPSHGAQFFVTRQLDVDAIIVGEPTGLEGIAIGCRGSARIVIECRSSGGHSASPSIYSSACEDLVSLWQIIKSRTPNGYTSTLLQLECGDSRFNIVPRYGKMVVGVRVPVSGTLESFLQALSTEFSERCSYKVDSYTKPFMGKPGNPIARVLARALALRGLKPRFVVKHGTSDMVILASLTDSIAEYGPGDPTLSHTDLEWIELNEFYTGIEVYRDALLEFVKMEKLKYVSR
ncbi:MAG: M20/M25/M40 family metallo-hydrolase [Acidilobaceae archaeon]